MSILGGMVTGFGKGLAENQALAREQETRLVAERKAASEEKRKNMLLKLRQEGAINFISDPKIEALVQSQTLTPQQGVQMQMQQTEAANKPDETYRQLTPDEITQRGLDPAKQYQVGPKQRVTQIGSSGTSVTVNNAPQNAMPGLSKLGEGMTYLYNDDGTVKRDERGAPISVPVVGSKIDRENNKIEEANKVKASNEAQKATIAKQAIAGIREKINKDGLFDLPEVGVIGARLADNGLNQEAVDVKRKLETLQSIVSFDRLQQMREASPTGGALGAVSERELALLQSSMGALSNDMSVEDLNGTLDFLENILTKFEAYPTTENDALNSQGSSNIPDGISKELWNEMTPEERQLWN